MSPQVAATGDDDDLWKAIEADQNPRSGVCTFCRWLKSRSAKEQASWAKVMTSSFTTQSLYREAVRRGFPAKSDSAVNSHRREAHK